MESESLQQNNSKKLPEGFENWAQWKREDYLNSNTETKEFLGKLDDLEKQINKEKVPDTIVEPPESKAAEQPVESLIMEPEKEEIKEPEVEANPIQTSEPVPISQEENISKEQPEAEKSETEELKEFEKLRNDLAKTEALKNNFSVDSGISVEDLRKKYADKREIIAALVKKEAYQKSGSSGDSLNEEQKMAVNDFLFEELVRKENDAYLNALKANREETWKDRTKIEMAKVLGSKVMRGYLGLPKVTRL